MLLCERSIAIRMVPTHAIRTLERYPGRQQAVVMVVRSESYPTELPLQIIQVFCNIFMPFIWIIHDLYSRCDNLIR
jgi:hypothetical protein